MIDIDTCHFTYDCNGEIDLRAIIDYKHGSAESFSMKYASIQAQLALAEKADMAFFVVYTYLDPAVYPISMYFTIPLNNKAKSFGLQGWMSVREYSEFEHKIRGLIPSKIELANLSNKKTIYRLADGVPEFP